MTFSQYIINEYSEKFYNESLKQMAKCNSTLEEWFGCMYADYVMLIKADVITIGT